MIHLVAFSQLSVTSLSLRHCVYFALLSGNFPEALIMLHDHKETVSMTTELSPSTDEGCEAQVKAAEKPTSGYQVKIII